MLSQVNHWMIFVGTGVDVLLLLRVLTLKLHRTYLFITLACVLEVFFDGISLWLGETPEWMRVFLYSRFLMAFVFPVAAWDVFEELSAQMGNLRRAAISRTVTSLVVICIFGLIFSGLEGNDESTEQAFVGTMAVILWTGSATGSLTFLWVMHKHLRAQALQPPNNTFAWLVFFELFLGGEVASCFFVLLSDYMNATVKEVVYLILGLYSVAITAWCILKLRALPSSLPSGPVSENL